MKTSKPAPKKFFPQKGQGMTEYAWLLGLVAAIFLIAVKMGLFESIGGVFGSSSDNLGNIDYSRTSTATTDSTANSTVDSISDSISDLISDSTSSTDSANSADAETAEISLIPSPEARPLDWQTVLNDIKLTYGTITKSPDPNRAIASEYNLFAQVSNLTSGAKEYNYANGDVKGWNDLMAQMESQMDTSNFTSSYKKSSTGETFSISRAEGTNRVTLAYFDGNDETKTFTIYADDKNTMHFESPGLESNSEDIYKKYMTVAPNIYSGGWQYQR